jgi:hypothetical protein
MIVSYSLPQGGIPMHRWAKRLIALAAPLLLTGCLWGPGKFASDLTLLKNGSFILDYKGEIVLQTPPDAETKPPEPWKADMAHCTRSGKAEIATDSMIGDDNDDPARPCTAAELARLKAEYEKTAAEKAASKDKESAEMAKMFGLPGFDDESNRAFAAKLMKYSGWRSVTYRGKGVFDVDYHFEGRATQDFLFPALPDNNLIIPFIALRHRSDGSVLVTAPAFTGGAGPMSAAAGAGMPKGNGPVSRAQGRFTVHTDGEILTNNSEDGAAPDPRGRSIHWDVSPSSTKIPESLIRLQ